MFKPDLAQSDHYGEKGESNSTEFDNISASKGTYHITIELLDAVIIDAFDHREAECNHDPEGQKNISEYIPVKQDQDYE